MNKWIFAGIGLAVGLGIGGGAGWFLTKKKMTAEFDAALDQEIAKTKELYSAVCNQDCANCSECQVEDEDSGSDGGDAAEIDISTEDEIDLLKMPYTERVNALKDRFAAERGDRTKYSRETVGRAEKAPMKHDILEHGEEVVDPVELAINNDQPAKSIHIITPEQYGTEHADYEKESLIWWKQNKLLTTEDYDILDVPDLIGTEWRGRFGEFEPNCVYVRNEEQQTDYKIELSREDYYDYV